MAHLKTVQFPHVLGLQWKPSIAAETLAPNPSDPTELLNKLVSNQSKYGLFAVANHDVRGPSKCPANTKLEQQASPSVAGQNN
jgi:hypothetical protein